MISLQDKDEFKPVSKEKFMSHLRKAALAYNAHLTHDRLELSYHAFNRVGVVIGSPDKALTLENVELWQAPNNTNVDVLYQFLQLGRGVVWYGLAITRTTH